LIEVDDWVIGNMLLRAVVVSLTYADCNSIGPFRYSI